MIHKDGPSCKGCLDKLSQAHPALFDWFTELKSKWFNAHICWSWRSAAEQSQAFVEGTSKVPWPKSKHNFVDLNGRPCSLALDIFLINEDGEARFTPQWYRLVWEWTKTQRYPIIWGGTWEDFKDMPHFELVPGKVPIPVTRTDA